MALFDFGVIEWEYLDANTMRVMFRDGTAKYLDGGPRVRWYFLADEGRQPDSYYHCGLRPVGYTKPIVVN